MGGCCSYCARCCGSCCTSCCRTIASCPKRCCSCCFSKQGDLGYEDDEDAVDEESAEKDVKKEISKDEKIQKIQSLYDRRVRHHGDRIVMYDPEVLSTWRVLWMAKGTIFGDMRIWTLVLTLIFITLTVATLMALLVHSPKKLSTERFQTIGMLFKVLIAFMLGMFLNNALARWWNIVVKIMELLLSVKKLVYVLRTTNCEVHRVEKIKRLGLLAVYIFVAELESNWCNIEESTEEWEAIFSKVRRRRLITIREEQELRGIPAGDGQSNRSSAVLTWMCSLLREIHKDNAVSPPLYARLMLNANDADDKIALAKVMSTVQMPFMYTHMLTILVHANNILGAITMGLTMGTSIGELFQKQEEFDDRSPRRDIYTSFQMIAASLIISTFQPAIYQAFLQIAATLCYPFGRHGEPWAHIPVFKLVEDLEEQLDWMDDIIEYDKKFQDEKKHDPLSRSETTKTRASKSGDDDEEGGEGDADIGD